MALYQPTNIIPDLKGGVENGIILLPHTGIITDVDISWTVNGNSPMVAYKIDVYQNTAASTLTGSTGKVTLGTPFSAISADGTEARFTATVAYTLLSSAFIGAGNYQGKFKITMWWGSGANDYVEQHSLSVYEASREGEISFTVNNIAAGSYEFSGSYSEPASTSPAYYPLNWTMWTIYDGSGGGTIVQTTGKVWGASSYTWKPQLLLPGGYLVEFVAEQANGANLHYSEFIDVWDDDFVEIQDIMTAVCDHSIDAIEFKAPIDRYITRYGMDNEYLWDYIAERISASPWSFIWHGYLTANEPLFYLDCVDGTTISAQFDGAPSSFTLSPTGTNVNPNAWDVRVGDEVYICLTLGNFYAGTSTGYQWMIYAKRGSTLSQGVGIFTISGYTQSTIDKVRIPYTSQYLGFTIGFGSNVDAIKAAYDDSYKAAEFVGPQIVSTGGSGHLLYFGSTTGPFYLYRAEVFNDSSFSAPAQLIGIFYPPLDPSFQQRLLDYSAASGHTYNYYITMGYTEQGNYGLMEVQNITPCFGNWTLVVGYPVDYNGEKFYAFRSQFRFAWNVQSGTVVNGSTRNIQPTFTPYPAVMRSKQNRRQGTLNGLIGVQTGKNIDFGNPGSYLPTNETEASLRALSTLSPDCLLLLKDQRGNVMKVALAGEISLTANDKSYAKEITASVPWVEVGEANEAIFEDAQYAP